MNLDLLSKYRTQLMGIAIIGVVLFHSTFPVEYYSLLGFIKHNGYGGVEVFFLLSGFGIYFAINKINSTKEFYKKRALRILPYYLPIVFIYSILCVSVGYWKVEYMIYNMLTIGFWMQLGFSAIFDWYIPALIVTYLITPWFFSLYKKNKCTAMILFAVFPFLLILFNNWVADFGIRYLTLFLYRVPLYFIGFAIADFWKNHKDYKFSRFNTILLLAILIGALVGMSHLYCTTPDWKSFTKNGREMLFCFAIVFPSCMFVAYILSLFKNYRYPILTFFGTYTLTIYIFHERILKINIFWLGKTIEDNNLYSNIFNIIVIGITLVLAVWWQKFIDKIVRRLENKHN